MFNSQHKYDDVGWHLDNLSTYTHTLFGKPSALILFADIDLITETVLTL